MLKIQVMLKGENTQEKTSKTIKCSCNTEDTRIKRGEADVGDGEEMGGKEDFGDFGERRQRRLNESKAREKRKRRDGMKGATFD